MNSRIINFKNLRKLTTYNFTNNLSIMPEQCKYYLEDEYNDNLIYREKNYLHENKEPVIMQEPGNPCIECGGLGWKTKNNNKINSKSLKLNFDYVLCQKCKGTGLV